ncbi:MAG: selenocysteine-specific translation elongation factor [Acidobacteriota bacterium]|nr:selenocysteine-specific translation elongation factor [Acidobacteriota bacterium]
MRALTGTDPDRLKEEQERGITIDLGFAHLETGDVNLAFVDVPGHERFIRNMLAGAGGIDIVMLVVAADESVMPQTREHFHICRLLRVPAGIIVLSKSDAADEEMQELAAMEVRELVAGSFLEAAPMVAVSARTGAGLDALRTALISLASGLRDPPIDGPARLPVDRVFTVKGFGTVVTGTLVSGRLKEEDELALLPANRTVKARGLQVHGQRAGSAQAGRRVAVNLGGVELADVGRGDTLCTPHGFEATRRVDVAIDVLADARALRHGARIRFHQGTTEVLGRVAVAGGREPGLGARSSVPGSAEPGSGARESEIPPGASAYARIRLEGPAVLTRGDRFILRAYSPPVTVGGGVVLDPHPPRSATRNAAAFARFRRLDVREGAAAPQESAVLAPQESAVLSPQESAVLAFIDERGAAGLARSALVSRAGIAPADAEVLERKLTSAGKATRLENVLVSPVVLQDLSSRLLAAVTAHHAAQPLSDGMPREEARERLFGSAAPAVFEHVVASLIAGGTLAGRDRLTLAGHQMSLSAEEARAREAIERLFRDGALAPPDLAAVSSGTGVAAAVVDRVARLLVRQKTLIKVEALLFHADALSSLKADVVALKESEGAHARVDVAAFKARYGISRKYAIPLLEYLDRERITRRVGDTRVLL